MAQRKESIVSFVMSGGVGSRLWPLSREDFPKQFHDLAGGGSMLQKTIRRVGARGLDSGPVYLLASARHAGRVDSEIAGVSLSGGRPIFEPVGRNTAAAVAVAAELTLREHGDRLVLVVPSDHEISTDTDFWQTMERGIAPALGGRLVVFGIPPDHPETGYGYIEMAPGGKGLVRDVVRFVEKPDEKTAEHYLAAGNFLWNAGIFLFRASAMRDAYLKHAPDIWRDVEGALDEAATDTAGTWLPYERYANIRSTSVDYAIMENASSIAVVPASFVWSDLGSWQSLLQIGAGDEQANVVIGDVVAIDCERSYLRSEHPLVAAVGLKDMAVVATADTVFVAPVAESQHVRKIVDALEKNGRLEVRLTPVPGGLPEKDAYRRRVRHWLFEEAMPLWSTTGVDREAGGFFEALSLDGRPLSKPKRVRTMARQVYSFAKAAELGWEGPADELIDHGITFLSEHAWTPRGGWVRTLYPDGNVADPVEDAYDQAFVLLALAHALKAGHPQARELGEATFAFIDTHLADHEHGGFLEAPGECEVRRSNPHMHLLEAFLAWHRVTKEKVYLDRASKIVGLLRNRFFDPETWTLGEYFTRDWRTLPGERGMLTEPGHHFEWAWLLGQYADASGDEAVRGYGRKLYATANANGINRLTGLAFATVTRDGRPVDTMSRSWPQTEAVKAAIALDSTDGPDMKPEIEMRLERLFRWHIEPARAGLWIDQIDARGKARADNVPASILYHMVCAVAEYLAMEEPDL